MPCTFWPRGKFYDDRSPQPGWKVFYGGPYFHPYKGDAGFNTLNSKQGLLSFFNKILFG